MTSRERDAVHLWPIDPGQDLSSLCRAAVRSLPVDGAAVSIVAGADHTELVHASDATAEHLDELQFTLGEGPGRDAYRHGRPIVVTDLEAESSESSARARWPAFRRAAVKAGVRAVYAFPLRFSEVRVGTLLLYRTAPGGLDEDALRQARRVADAIVAAVVTRNEKTEDDDEASPEEDAQAILERRLELD